MIAIQKFFHTNSDYIGSLASGLCLIHCMFTPILFVVQAGHAQCSDIGPLWWSMIDYLFLVISAFAVIKSAKNSSSRVIQLGLISFWMFLATGILLEALDHSVLFSIIKWAGAIGLVIIHLINLRFCRCSGDTCCHQ